MAYHPMPPYPRLRDPKEIAREAKAKEIQAERKVLGEKVGDALGSIARADRNRRPNE